MSFQGKNQRAYVIDTMFRIEHPGTRRSMALLVCSTTNGRDGWLVDAATAVARMGSTIQCVSPRRCDRHELVSLEEALARGALVDSEAGIQIRAGMLVAVLLEKPALAKGG